MQRPHVRHMTGTQAPSAAARTGPMPFGAWHTQQPQMIENMRAPVRDTQRIGIGFFHAVHPMRALAEGPASSLFKPELSQKIFMQWTGKIGSNSGVACRRQPVFPDRDTAIAIGVDMMVGIAGNSTAGLEYAGFDTRIGERQLNPDSVLGQRTFRVVGGAAVCNQESAFDQDSVVLARCPEAGLVERNRGLDLGQCQQGSRLSASRGATGTRYAAPHPPHDARVPVRRPRHRPAAMPALQSELRPA